MNTTSAEPSHKDWHNNTKRQISPPALKHERVFLFLTHYYSVFLVFNSQNFVNVLWIGRFLVDHQTSKIAPDPLFHPYWTMSNRIRNHVKLYNKTREKSQN